MQGKVDTRLGTRSKKLLPSRHQQVHLGLLRLSAQATKTTFHLRPHPQRGSIRDLVSLLGMILSSRKLNRVRHCSHRQLPRLLAPIQPLLAYQQPPSTQALLLQSYRLKPSRGLAHHPASHQHHLSHVTRPTHTQDLVITSGELQMQPSRTSLRPAATSLRQQKQMYISHNETRLGLDTIITVYQPS